MEEEDEKKNESSRSRNWVFYALSCFMFYFFFFMYVFISRGISVISAYCGEFLAAYDARSTVKCFFLYFYPQLKSFWWKFEIYFWKLESSSEWFLQQRKIEKKNSCGAVANRLRCHNSRIGSRQSAGKQYTKIVEHFPRTINFSAIFGEYQVWMCN